MKDKEKIEILKSAFEDIVWMAIRYADGRHTYAPHMVRSAVKKFQSVFPGWNPKKDTTITPQDRDELTGFKLNGDYLYDLFNNQ